MKRVTGSIGVRPLGDFDFDFFVPDNMSDEQIRESIKKKYECYIYFDTEDGYEEVTETVTRYKKVIKKK